MSTRHPWLLSVVLSCLALLISPVRAAEELNPETDQPAAKETAEQSTNEEEAVNPISFFASFFSFWRSEPKAPEVPFELTPQEQADVDSVLQQWEKRNSKVFNLRCYFKMWEYDTVFGPADKPKKESTGSIKYVAPDKACYKIDGAEGEHWICDGDSIIEYNYAKKLVIDRKLPAKLHGKVFTDGPFPFFFQVNAEQLKQRYWWRIVTPTGSKGQVWIEGWPRRSDDAKFFQRIEIILGDNDRFPFALQMYLPNGKNRTVYRFDELQVNFIICPMRAPATTDKIKPRLPHGWELIVEQAPTTSEPTTVEP